jgi:uncharacterized sulfatase
MLTRRDFPLALGAPLAAAAAGERPNVLWLTCEDTGPHLGCYGDAYANTPNLDRLAARGARYLYAWSNAPVCAPARTTIISGMYPTSTGSEHMRSMTRLPDGMRMFPCYLRDAGYYATNNAKEDYNLAHTGQVWDESSAKAHWRKRAKGQPFFSVFNFTITHESQIRTRPHTWIHDPARARVPAYHPDTIEVREDWAQYYDNITTMDRQAGQVMRQLEEDGLLDSTVVFFYGDHGSGMPRSKRWPYNSGLHVPMLVSIPERFRHLAPPDYRNGGTSGRLVGFVDLAPTVLSLAGVRPPAHMQGRAFLGPYRALDPQYQFGFRGRMDERIDLVRSARDRRYVYLRQFMPHKIYGQHIAYMFETPTTRVWKRLYDEGKLNAAQRRFWETKPSEELYDLENDRDEVNNLASSPEHRPALERMRAAVHNWMAETRDAGLLPESEIHSRSAGSTPYDVGHHTNEYPLGGVMATAEEASSRRPEDTRALVRKLVDGDSAVRYWAALGLEMRGESAVRGAASDLRRLLRDPAPAVRAAAAEALGRFGGADDAAECLRVLLTLAPADHNGVYTSIQALNAIAAMGARAAAARDAIARLPREDPNAPDRMKSYVPRLIEELTANLERLHA